LRNKSLETQKNLIAKGSARLGLGIGGVSGLPLKKEGLRVVKDGPGEGGEGG